MVYAMMESKRRDEVIGRQTVTGIVEQHGDQMLKITYIKRGGGIWQTVS